MPGRDGVAAALKTEFIAEGVEFAAATRYIDPVNWKACMPDFWCQMKALGKGPLPGQLRYHEVVSSDCERKSRAAFRAETDLLFNFMWLPDTEHPEVALCNYELTDGRPKPGDLILVDEGTIVVAKVGPGETPVRVTTTKRIQFSHTFSSRALAMIMCALGYADVAAELLCCAAKGGVGAGTAFPGVAPPAPPLAPARGARVRDRSAPRAGDIRGTGNLVDLMQDAVGVWARWLDASARTMERGVAGARPRPRSTRRDRSED